jgi:shikimate dehydrogenase
MRKYGLIGFPLSHSFSPGYFKVKFEKEQINDAEYKSYAIDKIEKFLDLVSDGLIGLNVTIPYKEKVIPYLDQLDETAKAVQAVNTIKVINGKLIGYNTDVYGFQISLESFLEDDLPSSALILGTGGAAKAVEYVLNRLRIKYSYVSRNPAFITYSELSKEIIQNHRLIINTTPLGMSPNIDSFPSIPYDAITSKHFFYDLVYNPEKTLFLIKAQKFGARIKNGKDMLHLQAEKSWQIWNHQ